MMNNKSPKPEIISSIIKLLSNFKISISVMIMLAIIWPLDLSLRPYVLKLIVDRIASTDHRHIFSAIGPLMLIYFMMSVGIYTIFRFYDYFVSIKMIPMLRKKITSSAFSLLLKQNYSYYQNNFTGNLANKVKDIINGIPDIIEIIFNRFLSNALALLIAVFTLFTVSPVFAAGILLWAFLIILSSILLSKKIIFLSHTWSEYGSRFTGKLVDSLANILSINLFVTNKQEAYLIDEASEQATIAEQKLHWQLFWLWFSYGLSFIIIQGNNLYFLMKYIEIGKITAGDFVVVLGINSAMVECLWEVAKDFNKFSETWGRIEQSYRLLNEIPEIKDAPNAKTLKVKQGKIEFKNVQFNYNGNEALFDDKSVTIFSGEKVGLVGYSGSGKSSFVNLILRLFDVSKGEILIDGQDLRSVTQNSLRSAIAMIPQEPSLFHRTLIDNIRYGDLNASDAQVYAAAKRAHADEFIKTLPLGYKSLAGERGVKLSGGQRQRIAIARAILKNAPILILDEATSQLDSVTENYIQDSIWQLMQGKTSIVIAHRLSTLAKMDRILVFDSGKIVQDGNHESLIKTAGMYKILWDAQKGGFLPENKDQEQ